MPKCFSVIKYRCGRILSRKCLYHNYTFCNTPSTYIPTFNGHNAGWYFSLGFVHRYLLFQPVHRASVLQKQKLRGFLSVSWKFHYLVEWWIITCFNISVAVPNSKVMVMIAYYPLQNKVANIGHRVIDFRGINTNYFPVKIFFCIKSKMLRSKSSKAFKHLITILISAFKSNKTQ